MITIPSPQAMLDMVGTTLGPSQWVEITQKRIDQFAEATGDHQWIHTDPERAAREAPGGTTIAHGYLTLSLLPALLATIYRMDGVSRGINYGANRLRFMAPVPVGARLRLAHTIKAAEPIEGGVKVVAENLFEIEGSDRPVAAVETIGLFFD